MQRDSTAGFIEDLRTYRRNGEVNTIYDHLLLEYLAWYFEKGLSSGFIPAYDKSDGLPGIHRYLYLYLDDAMETLRTGTETEAAGFRKRYEQIGGGNCVPRLTDAGFEGVTRALLILHLSHLMKNVTEEEWVERSIRNYFEAQNRVLDQVIQEFVRGAYRRGLYDLVNKSSKRGFSGKLGTTILRSFDMAGRIMFTFARPVAKRGEFSVTLLGESGDPTGIRIGVHSVHCEFVDALGMIRDVVKHWPEKSSDQKKLFVPDAKVSLF